MLLAPQLVHQDWLTACRLSAPHSSADTGTPHSRFAGFSVCLGRPDCPLFSSITGSWKSRPYSLALIVIPLLLSLSCCSLLAVRFLAVRYTAWCYSWRLAAHAVSLFLLYHSLHCGPARCSGGLSPFVSLLFPLGSARPDCPLSMFFVPGCPAEWTVPFFVSWSSSTLRFSRLSGCCCSRLSALVSLLLALLTACWGALFSRVLCIICFVIDWGCPLALAVLDPSVFLGGSFYSVSGGCQPPRCVAHTHFQFLI